MDKLIIFYFILYALLLGAIVFVGYFLQQNRERNYSDKSARINPEEIIVLIPFRNEANRISVLLQSIQKLNLHPKEYVFIDDHSSDNSVEIIEREMVALNYSIIPLPEETTGKKKALRFAINRTESTYILTLDADVEIQSDYFENLERLGNADMYVLPAVMVAKRFKEYFYEIDLILVNAANTGLAGLSRPIMASGANLLYRRDTFNRVDNLESHVNSASGDDTYLLRDFRVNKADVRLISNPKCAIHTETPQSFREFIDQRLRWIGKTGDLKDHLSTTLAIIQSVLTLFFLVLIIYAATMLNWKMLITIFALKTLIDLILFFPYFKRINRLITWFFIPVYEILFPFYVILILVLVYTYKPKWKGRAIYNDKLGIRN